MALLGDTAANIINQAALEVGLASQTDPYGSIDPNFVQLCAMLTSVGRDLRRRYQWSFLQRTYVFNTVAGSSDYALPTDYGAYIDQSGWNRTNRLPLGGPLSAQDYEYLQARLVGVVFTVLFRTLQRQFQVYPDGTSAPGNYVIAYEYNSSFWTVPTGDPLTYYGQSLGEWRPTTTYSRGQVIQSNGRFYNATNVAAGISGTYPPVAASAGITDGTVTWDYVCSAGSEAPTASADIVLMDSQLTSRALKLMWLRAKQMETGAAEQEFETVLEQAKNDDTTAPTLDLSRGQWNEPLLGERNAPITGYGL